MIDFSFCVPTRFVVGKNSPEKTGQLLESFKAKNILLVHDGGSYLENLLNTVRSSIKNSNMTPFEMEEKATRPTMSLVLKGVNFIKENNIDFVLAIGGGTVMDTAKAIAFFAVNPLPLTDWVLYRKFSDKCMNVGCICTLSGTGSEVSGTAMIIDDTSETPIKYPLFQDSIKFKFSIMDPSLTCSLPIKTTIAGAFDAITHIMEHYFNGPSGYDLQDRMCEGVMTSIMGNMLKVMENPQDYETRAQLQMGATLANSTLLGLGCESDWAVHYMENPITTETHNLHGSTLAIIAPAWMKYCYSRDLEKAFNFATRVMGVKPSEDKNATAVEGIKAFEDFLVKVGLPTHLNELGITKERFAEMAERACMTAGQDRLGGISKLSKEEVIAIYKLAE